MNKKLAFKFNFLFIALVLLVSGSFIFTRAFLNNETPQFSAVSVDENEEAGGVIVDDPASNVDLIANLDGWTESDPIVAPKEFTKNVGGYEFVVKLGADDDANKYQLFLHIDVEDEPEEIQLTTGFKTDYELISELIIDEIKRRIVIPVTDLENNEINAFPWEHSSDTLTTTIYKMKFLSYEFTLTLAIADDDNFGKINLLVFDRNNDNVIYLLGSENDTFVAAQRNQIDQAVNTWSSGRLAEKIFEVFESKLSGWFFKIDFIAITIGIGVNISVGLFAVFCWWFFIRKKPLSTISLTNKKKNKGKNKKK